jgi:hypothetical protein
MTGPQRPVRDPPTSFRPFDLLLLAGVAVMAAGIILGSPRVRTAAGVARRAMERETVAALTVGIIVLVILLVGLGLVAATSVAARRHRRAR